MKGEVNMIASHIKACRFMVATIATSVAAAAGLVMSSILATMADEQNWSPTSLPFFIGATLLLDVLAVGSLSAWMGYRTRASSVAR